MSVDTAVTRRKSLATGRQTQTRLRATSPYRSGIPAKVVRLASEAVYAQMQSSLIPSILKPFSNAFGVIGRSFLRNTIGCTKIHKRDNPQRRAAAKSQSVKAGLAWLIYLLFSLSSIANHARRFELGKHSYFHCRSIRKNYGRARLLVTLCADENAEKGRLEETQRSEGGIS